MNHSATVSLRSIYGQSTVDLRSIYGRSPNQGLKIVIQTHAKQISQQELINQGSRGITNPKQDNDNAGDR